MVSGQAVKVVLPPGPPILPPAPAVLSLADAVLPPACDHGEVPLYPQPTCECQQHYNTV